jgi:hypothetical protein
MPHRIPDNLLPAGWHFYALIFFAVAAGQVARLGQKLERGGVIGWRNVMVEASMLPAFGSLGGALAVEYGWPIGAQLGVGITAGWTGFGMFKLIVAGMRKLATQFLESTGKSEP